MEEIDVGIVDAEKEKAIIDGFRKVINENSFENYSDTPDFILAEFAYFALLYHTRATVQRSRFYSCPSNSEVE
jgi:hypothetical protein